MTFDEMLDTWRTQDKAPLYGLNQDLLQLVLRHEQSGLRRGMRVSAWVLSLVYVGFSLGMVLFFAMIFSERHYGDEPRPFWGYILAAAGIALGLGAGIALWISRRRQALRERSFGNTLRGELQRHLSLIDYALSRQGRARHAFLIIAPLGVLAVTFTLLSAVVDGRPINLMRMIRMGIGILAVYGLLAIWGSSRARNALLPRQRRLKALLEELDVSDGPSAD
jgi:hypothetical protein